MHNKKNASGLTAAREPGSSRTALPSSRGNPTTSPLTAAVLAVLYPGALTLAQDASPESGQQQSGPLEEIVVTATRREENLQNVAQSVWAFSTADIAEQAFRNTPEVRMSICLRSSSGHLPEVTQWSSRRSM